MSIPFLSITCTSCSFRGSSLATVGRFQWSDQGQVFNFDRQLGLCLDCNGIVAIEKFPDAQIMKRARRIRPAYVARLLFRLLETDQVKYLASQKGFDVLERVLALKRQPVCLECGTSAVRPIIIPKGVNSDAAVATDLGHPWCAGKLQIQASGGMRIGLKQRTRIYDIYGRLTSTIED